MTTARPAAEDPPATRDQRWVALALVCVMSFISTLDITVVLVAFDDMRDSFDASPAALSWVVTAYTIVAAALLVPSGRWADRRGARTSFVLGVALFTLGSLLSALSWSAWFLIAARVVQAMGSALQMPAALAIISEYFKENRASAVGIWGMTSGLGSASGPLVGAVLTEHFGWRSIFTVNVPIGLVVVLVALRLLRRMPGRDTTQRPDYVGSGLIVVAVASFTLALVQTEDWGWADPRVWGSLVVAIAGGVALVVRCRRSTAPILDLALFRIPSFRHANVIALVFPVAFFVQFIGLLSYFRVVWDDSSLRASARMTIPSVITAMLTGVAGRIADRHGHRAAIVPGAVLYALGSIWMLVFLDSPTVSWASFLPGAILLGVGVGLTYANFNSAAVHALPPDRYGAGGAMNLTINRVGGTIGVAVAVALLGTDPDIGTYRGLWVVMLVCAVITALGGAQIDTRRAPTP
jgi:EmrB/QacA subfamily drug resistance transporter